MEAATGSAGLLADLNNDGSGTDQDWIDWVTAVAQRNAGQYGSKIKYFEIWNEWNIQKFWQGTPAQLARMEQDARCVVEGPPAGYTCKENNSLYPSGTGVNTAAKIVTPSPVGAHPDLNSVGLQLASLLCGCAGDQRNSGRNIFRRDRISRLCRYDIQLGSVPESGRSDDRRE